MTYEASLSHIRHIRSNWGWFLALGIIFIIGGIVAIAAPLIATVLVTAFVGAAIAIVGVMQIIQAWQTRSWGGFALQLIIGIVLSSAASTFGGTHSPAPSRLRCSSP